MTESGLIFKKLVIGGWRQFDAVEIDLHPRLTVITGANGAGKTTLLNIFCRHFGWSRHLYSLPRRGEKGFLEYFTGFYEDIWTNIFPKTRPPEYVGSLFYSNGAEAELKVPTKAGAQYELAITNQVAVPGIHVDSHQAIPFYKPISTISLQVVQPKQAYDTYNSGLMNAYQGGHTEFSTTYRIREAMISMALLGEGNKYAPGHKDVLDAYLGFIEKLRTFLPESLGFIDLSIRVPEVVFVTKAGEFPIDAASGGLLTLIDIAWRIYMYSLSEKSFVVTMDEPENHLHPSMQRSLLRRLLRAFPDVQFIVSTHSPFMVSSIRDSNVYVLRYVDTPDDERTDSRLIGEGPNRRVVSVKLDTINRAGNASEILREVLGMPATIPEWVEENIAEVLEKYRGRPITKERLSSLRAELAQLGYSELYPQALSDLTKNQ